MTLQIIIFITIVIGCSLITGGMGLLMGRLGWMKTGVPLVIFPALVIAILCSFPVMMYLPYMPFVPEGKEEAISMIIIASWGMNWCLLMDGVKYGEKRLWKRRKSSIKVAPKQVV